MTDFVRKLGSDYFFERWRGAWFNFNGVVASINGIRTGENNVQCSTIDGDHLVIPLDFFVGFEILKYPPLGYRRIAESMVFRITKQQGYLAGIRQQNLTSEASPMTALLLENRVVRYSTQDLIKSVFLPQYDSPDAIRLLVEGEISNVVLDQDTLIEPSFRGNEEGFDVFFKGSCIGGFQENGEVQARNRKNKKFIEKVVAQWRL